MPTEADMLRLAAERDRYKAAWWQLRTAARTSGYSWSGPSWAREMDEVLAKIDNDSQVEK